MKGRASHGLGGSRLVHRETSPVELWQSNLPALADPKLLARLDEAAGVFHEEGQGA
jgi:hypothetical protein